MRNQEWNNQNDPWDQGTYTTGPTQPPKSHGGLIALLLVIVIALSGVVTVLGVMNIRLLQHSGSIPEETVPIRFSNDTSSLSTEPSLTAETGENQPAIFNGNTDVTIDIHQSPKGTDNIPQEGGMSLQDIYEQCINSVVSISCTYRNGSSSGTGVVLTADGYIVTNCHVVDGASSIQVRFTSGIMLDASLVGSDEVSDLAVLHVEATDLIPAQLGDSSLLRVGDTVVAIGDPLGIELRGTMTDGIVSAINRDIQVDGRIMTLIQTNAALNSGNSGGPLINCYGQVIGINTMKMGDTMSSAGVEGLGFAIPSTTVQEIVSQLISQGYVSGRPSIGISGETISSLYQMYYRLPTGLYITSVFGSAEEVGIREGDILISMNGTRIYSQNDLNTLVYACEVGDKAELVIYRSGKQYTVTVTVDEAK